MRAPISILAAVLALVGVGCASGTASKSSRGATAAEAAAARQQQDPLYSLTLMRQGSILMQQDQYREALKRFEEADRIAPGNATVYNMMGLCYMRMGQLDKALESFNGALDLIPSFTDARNNRGAAYLSLQQYRLAEVDFVAVLGDSTYPHRWSVYYNLGVTYMKRDQLGAAEENFLKAITSPQPVFEAYVRLSELARDQGRTEKAIEYLEEAHLSFPERIEASLQLGRLLVEVGRPGEARPYLQEVVAKQPGSQWAEEAAALLGNP